MHTSLPVSFGQNLSLVAVGSVALGVVGHVEWAAGIALAIAACSLALAVGGSRNGLMRWCLWGAVGALGLAHGAHARDLVLAPSPQWAFAQDGPVIVDARLRRDASLVESGVRLELDDVRLFRGDDELFEPVSLAVRVVVAGASAPAHVGAWTAGRRVILPIRLRSPALVRNPGSPSVRWQRLTRPFGLVGTVKSAALVEVQPGPAWQELAARVRRHVRTVAATWLAPRSPQTAAVVTAILIGDRGGLDDAVIRRLQVAGTFHVIAISGGNVAILTALCLFFVRLGLRSERLAVLATLFVVIAYGLLVGRDASVERAVVAATLYLTLRLIGVVPRPINVLAITAVVCVMADPMTVVDVGAWLSFGATLGLITILPRLLAVEVTPPGAQRPGRRGVAVVRALFMATVAAEMVILPMTSTVFMRVGFAGLLLNFVAIPAMTIVQLSGLLLCVVSFVPWSAPASAAAAVAHAATSALLDSAALVDIVPWIVWRTPPPPLSVVAAYYLALIAALNWGGHREVARGAVVAAVLCAAAMATAPWVSARRPPAGWLRVVLLDVGQGEAIAAQLPGGRSLLVDAGGSAGAFDVGGRIVTPALWALGVRRLDWLAITHGDVDHAGGALRVTEDLRPREVWEGVPVPLNPLLLDLRKTVLPRGVAWRRLQEGHQLEVEGVLVDLRHPAAPDWERPRVRNDDSMVIRLRFGLVEVLLTGDAGSEFESAFTSDAPAPPIRILKVAHHGSRTSSSERFLDTYRPTIALVSAGQSNLFGHPSPVVLDRLRHRRIDVFRTDRDGAIVIETDGREAYVRSASGRRMKVQAVRTVRRPPRV